MYLHICQAAMHVYKYILPMCDVYLYISNHLMCDVCQNSVMCDIYRWSVSIVFLDQCVL